MKVVRVVGSVAVLAVTLNVAAVAQQRADTTAADTGNAVSANELTEVIVTGTRRLDRTVAESSAPIDVITGKELENYPSASMLDTLSNLVPSFIVGQTHFRCVQLRAFPVVARPAGGRNAGHAQWQTHEPFGARAGLPGR